LEGRQLFNGLSATYFDNPDFTGATATSIDADVNFKWSKPKSQPIAGIDHNTFSARWSGSVRAAYSETYTFTVAADDGARLWVNGELLVDRWSSKRAFKASGSIALEAGKLYDIQLEYRQNVKAARVSLKWRSPSLRKAQVIPASMLYPPSTPSTPDVAAVVPDGSVSQVADARDFGAVGDGIHDDAPALQAAIDALPAYGTLRLEPRTYKLNKGLVIHKPLTVDGNGGLLLLNTSAFPANHQIFINSTMSDNAVQWTETVTAGQSTFHVSSAPGQFSVGQWVFLELGQDPNDPNEQHFTAMTQVAAVTADSITTYATVPYDINNGAYPDRITAVDSLATDVHVRDLKFDNVDGTVADAGVWIQQARDVSVDGISGRFNIATVVVDSSLVRVQNVVASLVDGHSAAGRAFSAWGSSDVTVTNVKADTSVDKAVFFLESWSRNTTFRNIDVRWRYPKTAKSAVFHLTGGSYGTFADQVRIESAAPIMLVGSGSQSATYSFGTVALTGPVYAAPLYLTDDLTIDGRRYAQPLHVTQTIDLQAGWDGHLISLAAGTIKSVKLTATDGSSISQLFVINAARSGRGFPAPFASRDTLEVNEFLGQAFNFNDAGDSLKTLALYTPASITPGAKLTIDVEYFPAAT
jgi:hypothetical protein